MPESKMLKSVVDSRLYPRLSEAKGKARPRAGKKSFVSRGLPALTDPPTLKELHRPNKPLLGWKRSPGRLLKVRLLLDPSSLHLTRVAWRQLPSEGSEEGYV
uniref:Uncharacterized protein n=1 Tax=Cannabis sativa TaxID=3483 RepID=A0A803P2I8_CANSA